MGIHIDKLKAKTIENTMTYTYSESKKNMDAISKVADVFYDYGIFIDSNVIALDSTYGRIPTYGTKNRKAVKADSDFNPWTTVLVGNIELFGLRVYDDGQDPYTLASPSNSFQDIISDLIDNKSIANTIEYKSFIQARKTLDLLGIPIEGNYVISHSWGWTYSKKKLEEYIKPIDQMGSSFNEIYCPITGEKIENRIGITKNLNPEAIPGIIVKNINYLFCISFDNAPFANIRIFDVYSERLKKEVGYDCLKIAGHLNSRIYDSTRKMLALDLRKQENIDLVKILFGMQSPTKKQHQRIKRIKKYLFGLCTNRGEEPTRAGYYYFVPYDKYMAKKKFSSRPKFKKRR